MLEAITSKDQIIIIITTVIVMCHIIKRRLEKTLMEPTQLSSVLAAASATPLLSLA